MVVTRIHTIVKKKDWVDFSMIFSDQDWGKWDRLPRSCFSTCPDGTECCKRFWWWNQLWSFGSDSAAPEGHSHCMAQRGWDRRRSPWTDSESGLNGNCCELWGKPERRSIHSARHVQGDKAGCQKKHSCSVMFRIFAVVMIVCVQNFCRSFPQKSDVLTGKSQRGCRVAVEGDRYWCQDFRSACCYWSHHERRWSPYQATSYHFAATINSDHDWPWLHIHLLRKLSLKVKYAMNIWVHGQKQPDNSWIKWHRWARCYGKGQSTMSHSLLDPCRQCPWALHLWPTDLLCNLCDS